MLVGFHDYPSDLETYPVARAIQTFSETMTEMQNPITQPAYPDFQNNQAFVTYSRVRSVYMKEAEDVSARVARDFADFSDIDGLVENLLDVLYERLSPALDVCVRRLGTEYAIFEYSTDDVFEHLIESSAWLEECCETLFKEYLERRSAVEDDRQYREARKDGRSRWNGGGFGLTGAISGAAKAGLLNMGSGLLHGAFNAAADALQQGEFAEFRRNYVQSRGYRRGIVNLFFELAVNLHLIEIELAAQSGQERIQVFENREKREKSEKMIANIERIGLGENELRLALVKAIEFYPYNPRTYEVWLQKFGDAEGTMQQICDSFSLIDLKGRKQQALRNECTCGAVDSEEKFADRIAFFGLPKDISFSEFRTPHAPVTRTHSPAGKSDTATSLPARLQDTPSPASGAVTTSTGDLAIRQAPAATTPAGASVLRPATDGTGTSEWDKVIEGFSTDPDKKFYVAPEIPSKKIAKFIDKYRYPLSSDEVLFYFDETVFGSGDTGAALSHRGIHINLSFGEAHDLPWTEIKGASIGGLLNKKITIKRSSPNKDVGFVLTQSNKGTEALFEAIQRILSVAR